MTDRFDKCADFVLKHETEYDRHGRVIVEHDPNDPGGTTKYGIDQRDHPKVDVASLTRDEAKAIYHALEWTKGHCDQLPKPWDLVVFDSCVNPGLGWALKALQAAVGAKADGVIGPKTIAAVKAAGVDALEAYLGAREDYYRKLPAKRRGKPFRDRFLKGWLARVTDLRTEALS